MARTHQTRRQTRKGPKNLTDDERQAVIADVHKQLGILPKKPPNVDEGPYEADTTEDTDTTKQAAAPTPKDTINIDSDDDGDNGNDDEDEEEINADTNDGGDVENNNILHP